MAGTHTYYVSKISDNIGRTPEGYLVAKDCVLARTGYQRYSVGDLPQEKARDLGIDTSKPGDAIDLYRSAKDVFSPEFISSLESKPVVNDHPPNREFVNPSNIGKLGMGHVVNVHRGDKALDSGEWPLVGDIVITRQPLIDEVANKRKRELSVGYDFEITRNGNRILQIPVMGNHVAVVKQGRAGAEARINDSRPAAGRYAPELSLRYSDTDSSGGDATERKVKMAKPKNMSWLDYIFGMGYKAVAVDAEPEDIAEMRKELAADQRARASDEDEEEEASDEDDDTEDAGDEEEELSEAGDRAAMHAALDRLLDAEMQESPLPPSQGTLPAADVDVNELRSLMDEYFSEEGSEPEHMGDDDDDDEEASDEDDEESAEDDEDDEEASDEEDDEESANDEENDIGSESQTGDRKRAADGSRFIEGKNPPLVPKNVLNLLRRSIVKANDSAAINWFNHELARHNQGGTSGGYRDFASAAGSRNDARINEAARSITAGQDYSQLQQQIDARRGKPISQVKEVVN